MREIKDPEFRRVSTEYERGVLDFINHHTREILDQLSEDSNYQSQKTEVPKIPIFDGYLSKLEKEIRASLTEVGYFNGAADRLVQHYRGVFYHSSLPNLSYSALTHPR